MVRTRFFCWSHSLPLTLTLDDRWSWGRIPLVVGEFSLAATLRGGHYLVVGTAGASSDGDESDVCHIRELSGVMVAAKEDVWRQRSRD